MDIYREGRDEFSTIFPSKYFNQVEKCFSFDDGISHPWKCSKLEKQIFFPTASKTIFFIQQSQTQKATPFSSPASIRIQVMIDRSVECRASFLSTQRTDVNI